MRKNKQKILQEIRMRAALKCSRQKNRRRKQKRNDRNIVQSRQIVSVPRKFRRIKSTNSIGHTSVLPYKKECLRRFLPSNLRYLLETPGSPFLLKDIQKKNKPTNGVVSIPPKFSIIDTPEESYDALRKIIYALLIEDIDRLTLDYANCESTELSTQVLLDIILKDYVHFKKICRNNYRIKKDIFPQFGGININNKELKEMMWSVGSPATLGIAKREYDNVVEYPLRIHSIEKNTSEQKRMNQKELDTTELIDYVITCLGKMNKKLTPQKRDDLCTVIGEILINAEEHSTTNKRFSIGFFRDYDDNNNHCGLFRLVILNFGRTIYEKFKSDDCPNKNIVKKMLDLSNKYTKKLLFLKGEFEEENLWTLYALQEGVTSVSTNNYKRGNGSIRFIESFFNIKGNTKQDDISKMTLLSGNTKIIFDGRYNIVEKNKNNETFRVMAFNNDGDIECKPDSKCVCKTNNYFPGTMLSVKLLLNEDDIQEIK
ncbi:MAG: hypothetical protein PUD89_01625 [Bacteroidales bacterium]|nr:hypothetical protein [Bacteroidales bacterium]